MPDSSDSSDTDTGGEFHYICNFIVKNIRLDFIISLIILSTYWNSFQLLAIY